MISECLSANPSGIEEFFSYRAWNGRKQMGPRSLGEHGLVSTRKPSRVAGDSQEEQEPGWPESDGVLGSAED